MRKIVLNIAMSLDGYISEPDGNFDWISGHGDNEANTETNFEFSDFLKSIDTIVMGSKSYQDCGTEMFEDSGDKRIIITTSRDIEIERDIELFSGDIVEYILDIRKEEGKDIWIFGGAQLADAFIKSEIIDEYIIGIIPVILGEGRRLFLEHNPRIELHLNECTVQEGITILRYTSR